MPETVTYHPGDKFILIQSVGHVETAEWKESLKRVCVLQREYGVSAVLVDVTKQTQTSDYAEIIEFAERLCREVKFALFVENVSGNLSESTEGKQRFLESAAADKGCQIKAFIVKEEAEAWLAD